MPGMVVNTLALPAFSAAPTGGVTNAEASNTSATAGTMSASGLPMAQRTCRCLNLRIHYHELLGSDGRPELERGVRVRCSIEGIHAMHPLLLARETVQIEGFGSFPGVCCLNCSTLVYYVTKAAPLGPSRVVGFQDRTGTTAGVSAAHPPLTSNDVVAELKASRGAPAEPIVKPADGTLWIMPDCLSEREIPAAERSRRYSPIFRILVDSEYSLFASGAHTFSRAVIDADDASNPDLSATSTTTSPHRPAIERQRRLSYTASAPAAATTRYALPPLPTSLITSPPTSPMRRNDSFSGHFFGNTGSGTGSTAVSSIGHSPSPSRSPSQTLSAKLDAYALDKLRQHRLAADAEIQELVRQKRAELEEMESRARAEVEVLLEKSKAMSGVGSRRMGSFGAESAVPVAPSMSHTYSAYSATSNGTASQNAVGSTATDSAVELSTTPTAAPSATSARQGGRADVADAREHANVDAAQSPRMFERRRAPSLIGASLSSAHAAGSAAGATFESPSSVGGLSASFAMRGRELPTETDWSTKRRLRERYPHADHSAIPSAVTSAATSERSESDAEEDRVEETRGRGRDRVVRASPGSSDAPGVSGHAEAEASVPGFVQRAPASTHIDNQLSAKGNVAGGQGSSAAIGSASTGSTMVAGGSAAPLSSSTPLTSTASQSEGLEPAPRIAQQSGATIAANSKARDGEKKVAFADSPASGLHEARPEASLAQASPSREAESARKEGSTTRNIEEGEESVFDIDEDLAKEDEEDDDDDVPGNATDELDARAIDAPAQHLDPLDADVPPSVATGEDTSPLTPFEANASASLRTAGSFSAAASRSQSGWSGPALRAASKRAAGPPMGSSAADVDTGYAADFDPASLRRDGRRVPVLLSASASAARGRPSESIIGDASITDHGASVGATGFSARARSKERAVPTRAPLRSERTLSNFSPEALESFGLLMRSRGTIGFRGVAVGEAEAKLSGLLAPHAPSHRRLWSSGGGTSKTSRKKQSSKYEVDDQDDDKWAAWQQRVLDQEVKRAAELDASPLARSLPTAGQPIPGGGFGGRAMAASTTTFKDETSGFDLEPKTSLPYQEKLMVPGLRQATRRLFPPASAAAVAKRLPTIPDAMEASPEAGRSAGSLTDVVPGPPPIAPHPGGAVAIGGGRRRGLNPSLSPSPVRGALPGSVVTRGFAPGGLEASNSSNSNLGDAQDATDAVGTSESIAVKFTSLSNPREALDAAGSATTISLTPTQDSLLEAVAAPVTLARRSPRPPYVPPPPPSSSSLVLHPDPRQLPAPLKLFEVACDDVTFAALEEGEEEEKAWEKVMLFMHRLERLKINRRTGWLHHRVKTAESIADHMYRMAVLAMLCPSKGVDIGKAVQLCLVHDLAEAEVGDLTPLDGVPREEKRRRESEAMEYLVHDLLGSSPQALRLEALWREYEERKTPEAKLVKDLDRFELCLQAVEYEREHGINDLQPFFRDSISLISHPRQRRWAVELARERAELWAERGYPYRQILPEGGDSTEERPSLAQAA